MTDYELEQQIKKRFRRDWWAAMPRHVLVLFGIAIILLAVVQRAYGLTKENCELNQAICTEAKYVWAVLSFICEVIYLKLSNRWPPYPYPERRHTDVHGLSDAERSIHEAQWRTYHQYKREIQEAASERERLQRQAEKDAEDQAKKDLEQAERAIAERALRDKTAATDHLASQFRAMALEHQNAQPGWLKDAVRTADINLMTLQLTDREIPQFGDGKLQWPYTFTTDYAGRESYAPFYDGWQYWDLKHLPDLCALYRSGSSQVQDYLAQEYTARLAGAHKRKGTSDPPAYPITPHSLSPAARVLFLPVLIDAGDGYRFNELDLNRSDLPTQRYIYRAAGSIIDLEHWEKAMTKISRYLNQPFVVAAIDGESLELRARPEIPASFPLTPEMVLPGQLFFGLDFNTGKPIHVPLTHLSHTLMQGPSGAGKSTFMHQVMASILNSMEAFETVYMLDLKYGLEAQHYAPLHEKITIIDRHDAVPGFVDSLLTLMETRAVDLKARALSEWDGPLIMVLIDEFSDILLATEKGKARNELETKLIRLTNLSRALGIRFWVQVQNATADAMPTAFRRNLQSRISFKLATNQEAAQIFGTSEGLPADMTKLVVGQVIYRDGKTSDTYALQGAFVRFEDVLKLAGN